MSESSAGVRSEPKIAVSISAAMLEELGAGDGVGFREGEGVDQGDLAEGAPQVRAALRARQGRVPDEDVGQNAVVVPDRASDGGADDGAGVRRGRVVLEELVERDTRSLAHEGLELEEAHRDRERVKVGGSHELVEDVGEARVVDDEAWQRTSMMRKLRAAGQAEEDGSV
eukprot:14519903-Heterocapsa_arctica.AAC.1